MLITLEIFVFLFILAFALFCISLWRKNYAIMIISGIFFCLVAVLLYIGVYYVSGSTDTYSYMCYSCDGSTLPSILGNESLITSIVTVNDYTVIDWGNLREPLSGLLLIFGLYVCYAGFSKLFFKKALGVDVYFGDDLEESKRGEDED